MICGIDRSIEHHVYRYLLSIAIGQIEYIAKGQIDSIELFTLSIRPIDRLIDLMELYGIDIH